MTTPKSWRHKLRSGHLPFAAGTRARMLARFFHDLWPELRRHGFIAASRAPRRVLPRGRRQAPLSIQRTALFLLSVIGLLLVAGNRALNSAALSRSSPAKPASTGSTLLLLSGEDGGYLEPCGCSSPQLGGLPRRGSVLSGHPGAIPLDNGDWVDGVGRQDELKVEATLHFLGRFHYAAANPGEKDYALGYPQLLTQAQQAGVPLLSTNVTLPGGDPAFHPWIMVRRSGGTLAIFGELSPGLAEQMLPMNPMLTVQDPAAALVAAHRKAPADASVLLYHGPAGEARALAARFPWLTLIVAAHEGDEPESLVGPHGIPIVSVGLRARYVGRVQLSFGPAQAKTLRALTLGPSIPDSRIARGILDRYEAEVAAEDLLARVPRAPLDGNWYAGSAACASCHLSAFQTWARSRHPHAYSELLRVGHSRDPDCVSCHVIGLDRVGGFRSFRETPLLGEVGCESCHGPQGLHAAGRGPAPAKLTLDMCVSCHTPDQSPRFNVKTYWPKIAH